MADRIPSRNRRIHQPLRPLAEYPEGTWACPHCGKPFAWARDTVLHMQNEHSRDEPRTAAAKD